MVRNLFFIGAAAAIALTTGCATTSSSQSVAKQSSAASEADRKAALVEKRKQDFREGKSTLTPDEFFTLNVDPGDAGGALDDFEADD